MLNDRDTNNRGANSYHAQFFIVSDTSRWLAYLFKRIAQTGRDNFEGVFIFTRINPHFPFHGS